jgi:transcriptional regulator with XRE-family HTH domain
MGAPADEAAAQERRKAGQAVAAARKTLGLSQAELARQATISVDLLSSIEQGRRSLTLGVREALTGVLGPLPDEDGSSSDPVQFRPVLTALSGLMDAYDIVADPPSDPRSIQKLRHLTQTVTAYRLSSRYSQLATVVPGLIADLTATALHLSGEEQREAFGLLALAWRAADAIADKTGSHDLSARATELIRWAAARSGDPLLEQMGAYVRAELFFSGDHTRTGLGLRVIDAAASTGPQGTSPAHQAMYGALCMRGAVLAARAGNREEAADRIAEAQTAAEHLPEAVYHGTAFGPESVRIHALALAVEAGDTAHAVELAAQRQPSRTLPAERRSHFHIEAARAYCMAGQTANATEELWNARAAAPQHTRYSLIASDTIKTLVRRSRTPPPRLLQLAKWSHLA